LSLVKLNSTHLWDLVGRELNLVLLPTDEDQATTAANMNTPDVAPLADAAAAAAAAAAADDDDDDDDVTDER
jgi:hypothetical protein